VGGAGSGGTGVPGPIDWTDAFVGVYRFELPPPDLGRDATIHGNHLMAFGIPEQDASEYREGSAALFMQPSPLSGLTSASDAFKPTASFTVGGWFRILNSGLNTMVGPGWSIFFLRQRVFGRLPRG
jgi:hypothetical protein